MIDDLSESAQHLPAAYYGLLREQVLDPEYNDLSNDDIDALLSHALENMAPEEAENFWKTMKNALPQVLPVAGSVVGGIVGGPAGVALGGTLGGMASKVVGGMTSPQKSKPTAQGYQVPSPQAMSGTPHIALGSNSASTQLMSYLQNPQFLQSILGLILGDEGKKSIPVGKQGAEAPAGAFLNTLIQLATKALDEANVQLQQHGKESPGYLYDAEGNPLCSDPASPIERAETLLENLKGMNRGILYSIAEEKTRPSQRGSVIEWLAEANLIDGYEDFPYMTGSNDNIYPESHLPGHPLGFARPIPPYIHEMKDRVLEWPESPAKNRLQCFLSGIIENSKTDLRWYNRNWVRRVVNMAYAPGLAISALSDLSDQLKYYKNFKGKRKDEDFFIKNLDENIINGILELRKFLIIWPELPQVQEMAKFVTDNKNNSASLYNCYEEVI